jgi:hypothetical protein
VGSYTGSEYRMFARISTPTGARVTMRPDDDAPSTDWKTTVTPFDYYARYRELMREARVVTLKMLYSNELGEGSGITLTAGGLIVTNRHVGAGDSAAGERADRRAQFSDENSA